MNSDYAWIGNENDIETKDSGTKSPGTKIVCRVGRDRLHLSTSLIHRLDEFVCRRSNRHACAMPYFVVSVIHSDLEQSHRNYVRY